MAGILDSRVGPSDQLLNNRPLFGVRYLGTPSDLGGVWWVEPSASLAEEEFTCISIPSRQHSISKNRPGS